MNRIAKISLAVAVAMLGGCGAAIDQPAGTDPGATTQPTTTVPTPPAPQSWDSPNSNLVAGEASPPTPEPAAHQPEIDEPAGDCRRSIRLANIHYHLAFFSQCLVEPNSPPFPVYRKLDEEPTLQEKLQMLVEGTRVYERADGLTSGFDSVDERDQIEIVVDIDSTGIATIDFLIEGERWNPGSRAGTSAQYLSFMEPLEATVFSDLTVTALDRSTLCWGESDCNGITTRETWEGMLFTNYGVLCTPQHFDSWGCEPRDDHTYRAAVVGVAADDVLNVRSGPGVAYFKVGALEPDAVTTVLQNERRAKDGALWRLVRSDGGDVGWVNSSFLANAEIRDADRNAEEQLADAFVEFGIRPSDRTFAALPLADTVALGLGPDIVTEVAAATLRNPATWELDVEYFRAYVGTFSAFNRLAWTDTYVVTVGLHNHCASPPMPAPEGYTDMARISIQPDPDAIDSCLMWGTVDFFVNADGEVAAITLDLWEP